MNDAPLPPALVIALRDADVPDETLYLASEAASPSWAPALGDDDRRAWALLVVASLEAHRRGDTRLPLPSAAMSGRDDGDAGEPGVLSTLLRGLGVADDDRRRSLALAARLLTTPALAPIVGEPGAYKPFIVDDGCLYHQRVLAVEERLAAALRARLHQAAPAVWHADVARAFGAAPAVGAPLSDEQQAAVLAALQRPLTVISGGPGTGKTSVIGGLLRAAKALGLLPADIALGAPTGKAAQRITESLDAAHAGADAPAAQTLHRLLGYQPADGRFRHHRNYPLPHKLIVVDEGSMIDLFLMERLLGAVAGDARLVLLGDADQLPSVDAGAVFRDLAPLAVRLTRSYRLDPSTTAGRAILTIAEAIRAGRSEDLALSVQARAADLAFTGVEQLAPPARRAGAALEDFLDRWWARAQAALPAGAPSTHAVFSFRGGEPDGDDGRALAALFAQQHQQRILCVTRGAARPTGADAVNAALHRRAARAGDGAVVPGEPLIMLRNDYDRGLFNGDLGLCVRASVDGAAPALTAIFPRGAVFVAHPLATLGADLALAHALTVHRAQGSEVEAMALILPDDDLPLLTRELVYTALTRARTSAVVVGSAAILQAALARHFRRSTGLGARLAAPF
ncbi:MAG TPA: AAA family ATPase [Polyangia bacterium]